MPDVHSTMPLLPGVRNKIFLHPRCVQNQVGAFHVGGYQTVEFTTAFSENYLPHLLQALG